MAGDAEIRVHYDEDHDMLMVTLGEYRDAYTDPASGRLHIRRDVYTEEAAGFVITAFIRGFLREHPDFQGHFETIFGDEKEKEEKDGRSHAPD